MKKIFYTIMVLITITAVAYAVPQYINYQGILRDIPGNLQNGTFAMDFKIYNTDTGGSFIFDSGSTQVTVSNGLYNVRLGPVDSATHFDGNDKWLEVTVGSDTLSPRLRINSVAYALRADVAGTAASATYATTSGTATNATTATYATTSGTATNAATVNNIGASTSASASKLYPLDSSGTLSGIPISATASGTNNALLINGGKIGISPSSSATATVTGGDPTIADATTTGNVGVVTVAGDNTITSIRVSNSLVTANSIIFITPNLTWAANTKWLKITKVNNPAQTFTVSTGDNVAFPNLNITSFYYLIIN